MHPDRVLEQVEKLSGGHPILVTLSGGNPALQPLEALLSLGRARGHTFALETQGSVPRDWFGSLDHLVLSPKPPSSGTVFKPGALAECLAAAGAAEGTGFGTGSGPAVSLKIVVFDEADYLFARRIAADHAGFPLYLSIGNPAPRAGTAPDEADLTARLEWLLARCAADGWFAPTILPQLHVLLWGNKRGV